MRINKVFSVGGITQSIGGLATFLDADNCEIESMTKSDDSIVLILRRKTDGGEGRAHLRVKTEFESIASQLLARAFVNNGFIGLTLNKLMDLETGWEVESLQGRFSLK